MTLRPRTLARAATTFVGITLCLSGPIPLARAQADVDDLPGELELIPDLGSEPLEQEAYGAIRERRYVDARELADQMLRANPDSPAGHCTLGIVLHRAEGSLPRALYHLNRSLELFDERNGRSGYGPAPWRWYAMAIQETAQLNGAMGRNEEKLRLLTKLEQMYGFQVDADRGWPLMRLRRYDEARVTVERALRRSATHSSEQQVTALNALCAIEGEEQRREATYRACLQSVDLDRSGDSHDPVAYTNAAIGALSVLKLDEAERLILEGTEHFVSGTVSNPWLDLMVLYVSEGRTAEALDAMRRMFHWRQRQPPYMDEQNRAQTEVASAQFLVIAGRPNAAARITRRSLEQPDRTGYTSSDSEQMQSAAALVNTLAYRTAAERKWEEASWSPFWEGLRARVNALALRLRAWAAARQAAALLAEERILVSTVRPYLPGGSEVAEWVQPELVSILGPGVLAAAIEKARKQERLPEASAYFDAFDTEIAWQLGRDREALRLAERTLENLPGPEVLLQARVAAIGADAAWQLGQVQQASALFSRALQTDPGILRRMGIALPVRLRDDGSAVAARVTKLLSRSPRFTMDGLFAVDVRAQPPQTRACLLGPQREVLACADARPRAGENDAALARRLAEQFHHEAFAPRVDLTQQDIRSLDGSTTAAGGRSKQRLRSILDELAGPEED